MKITVCDLKRLMREAARAKLAPLREASDDDLEDGATGGEPEIVVDLESLVAELDALVDRVDAAASSVDDMSDEAEQWYDELSSSLEDAKYQLGQFVDSL